MMPWPLAEAADERGGGGNETDDDDGDNDGDELVTEAVDGGGVGGTELSNEGNEDTIQRGHNSDTRQ
jgi:hypothetical protein